MDSEGETAYAASTVAFKGGENRQAENIFYFKYFILVFLFAPCARIIFFKRSCSAAT